MAVSVTEVRGLVVRTYDLSESDKLLTIFTEQRGIVTAVARGGRGIKSRFVAAAQLFCYADFVLEQKGEYSWVKEAELIQNFFGLRSDIVKTALASYVCEVIGHTAVEEQADRDLLQLGLNTLYAISERDYDLRTVKAGFEIRAASILGFLPDLQGCFHCGAKSGAFFLDVMNGQVVCEECHRSRQQISLPTTEEYADQAVRNILCPLTAEARIAMYYVTFCKPERIFSFRIPEEDMRLMARACETYLLNHLERSFRSLELYHQVEDT